MKNEDVQKIEKAVGELGVPLVPKEERHRIWTYGGAEGDGKSETIYGPEGIELELDTDDCSTEARVSGEVIVQALNFAFGCSGYFAREIDRRAKALQKEYDEE